MKQAKRIEYTCDICGKKDEVWDGLPDYWAIATVDLKYNNFKDNLEFHVCRECGVTGKSMSDLPKVSKNLFQSLWGKVVKSEGT